MGLPSDVIAAIATGAGDAAIGIVRFSGRGAHAIALKMCRDVEREPPAGRLALTWLDHPGTGAVLDRAMVVFYTDDFSYTGEEAVELFCHGGRVVLETVLGACLDAGARAAAPGEFTRRAMANGRLDLAQAEAVALLSGAGSAEAAGHALATLGGALSDEVCALREDVLKVLAALEASLDFTEDDGVEFDVGAALESLRRATCRMDSWVEDERASRPHVSGVRVVLMGPPNAGKSSLFNAVLGRPRAIVHGDPGTTRDVVSEPMTLSGAHCVLMDTAGLRVADGEVESEGVDRALEAATNADVRVLVVDGSDPGVGKWMGNWAGSDLGCDIAVATKADLCERQLDPTALPVEAIRTSAVDGTGIQGLCERLGDLASRRLKSGRVSGTVIAGARQLEAVLHARDHAAEAVGALESGAPLEVAASSIRASVEALGEVTGANVTEDVLDRIFATFCIGK